MKEIWKDIKNYEGMYQISNFGNVKTLSRIIYGKNGKITNKISEKILKPIKSKNNYLQVILYKNNKKKNFYIHKLVAIYFIDNPENKKEVNHIDRNTNNNHVSNLEWVTSKENMKHLEDNYDFNFGRITIDMYDLDFNYIKTYSSIAEAGLDNGAKLNALGKPNIGNIRRSLKSNGNLTAYGHRFKYTNSCND